MASIIVCGSTHIDVAWKKSAEEHTELFESFIVRLLDITDSIPTYTYVLEQAWHLRRLKERRPDLWQRLLAVVQAGRIEVVGGFVSTAETNGPSAEGLARNLQLGLDWIRREMGVRVNTGWLIDTFGLNAQLPQMLRSFGIETLMANRFGGNVAIPAFRWLGIDDSEILVMGRDVAAPEVAKHTIAFEFVRNWAQIDTLFETLAQFRPGTLLVMPYTENECLPSARLYNHVRRSALDGDRALRFGTPSEVFQELSGQRNAFPIIRGELNPEFTGTFGNRTEIRTLYRRVESLLLDAERAAVTQDRPEVQPDLSEIWWRLCAIQFHDVYTGSGPDRVQEQTLAELHSCEQSISALAGFDPDNDSPGDVSWFNPSVKTRIDLISFPQGLVGGLTDDDGRTLSGVQVGDAVLYRATIPGLSLGSFQAMPTGAGGVQPVDESLRSIENESIRVEVEDDGSVTIRALPSGAPIVDRFSDWISIQHDEGSMQIEDFSDAEVGASAGTACAIGGSVTEDLSVLTISGAFPPLAWMAELPLTKWRLSFVVARGVPRVDLHLRIDWSGEASSVFLKVATTMKTSTGVFEIPFAGVSRDPYRPRRTARGSWPAGSFVALRENGRGLGVVNTGAHGTTIAGGTVWTTLLRAPMAEYAGMVSDRTSSQHGQHDFLFALVPFEGGLGDSACLPSGEALNHPFRRLLGSSSALSAPSVDTSPSVVVSAIKFAESDDPDVVVRLYDALGSGGRATIKLQGLRRAFLCSMDESPSEEVKVGSGSADVSVPPFGIVTVRLKRV